MISSIVIFFVNLVPNPASPAVRELLHLQLNSDVQYTRVVWIHWLPNHGASIMWRRIPVRRLAMCMISWLNKNE